RPGLQTAGIVPSTRSSAAGRGKSATVPVAPFTLTVTSLGCVSNTGGVVSVTLTTNVVLPTLRLLSVDEQVTVSSPTGNADPDAGLHVTSRSPSTASTAVGVVYDAFAPPGPVASSVTSSGTSRK